MSFGDIHPRVSGREYLRGWGALYIFARMGLLLPFRWPCTICHSLTLIRPWRCGHLGYVMRCVASGMGVCLPLKVAQESCKSRVRGCSCHSTETNHLCIVVLMDRWAYPSAAAVGAALVGERRGTLGEEDVLQRFRPKVTSLPRKRAHEWGAPPVGHMLGQRLRYERGCADNL